MISSSDITGLVLAGGRGLRMGGVDKGLQLHRGRPLAQWAVERLVPQVHRVCISANRHLEVYAGFGASVCADTVPGFAGPLAGILAGLECCATAWLATVPCDSPALASDLVTRLAAALDETGADIATAATFDGAAWRPQPVFCLLRSELKARLRQDLEGGEHRVGVWMARQRQAVVPFADARAFANINTLEELRRMQPPG